MPRYFLHIHEDGMAIPDDEGREFRDLAAARRAALAGARDLLCEQIRQGYLVLDHHIEIADGRGEIMSVVRFRDVFISNPDKY